MYQFSEEIIVDEWMLTQEQEERLDSQEVYYE